MTALSISVVLLWIAVIALAVTVFALARQIGVLHERIAPAGALTLSGGLKPGETAPDLRLATLDGAPLVLRAAADAGRGLLLFFLSPTCPVCRSLLPVVLRMADEERQWLEVVFASDGSTPEEHRAYVRERGLGAFPYVISQELGIAFGVGKLPYAALLDARGVLVAKGIVNTREHLESLLEAQRLGVADINRYLSARAVDAAATPAATAPGRQTAQGG
jgi:methylamine dehydrogenase accessory protein MauD